MADELRQSWENLEYMNWWNECVRWKEYMCEEDEDEFLIALNSALFLNMPLCEFSQPCSVITASVCRSAPFCIHSKQSSFYISCFIVQIIGEAVLNDIASWQKLWGFICLRNFKLKTVFRIFVHFLNSRLWQKLTIAVFII